MYIKADLVRMIRGEPCLAQARAHSKLKSVAVDLWFWIGQERSRTTPLIVVGASSLASRDRLADPMATTSASTKRKVYFTISLFVGYEGLAHAAFSRDQSNTGDEVIVKPGFKCE